MMQTAFDFLTAGRILFGRGKVSELSGIAQSYGKRIFLVSGLPDEVFEPIQLQLKQNDLELEILKIKGEPTIASIQKAVQFAREIQAELIIGIGGGSAIDTGKAVAALAANPGEPLDYLEVIGKGQKLQKKSLPYIVVPTTSGTGAEVTKNAVLKSEEYKVKVSLRSPLMFPTAAILDPELTIGVTREVTATTGMDALTQVLEPYVSIKANPLTDALCLAGLKKASWALRKSYFDGKSIEAREAMQFASLCGGLALANAGLGAVHGFAGPLGGMFPAPHGAVCARLLPFVIEANLKALREREPQNPALQRYREIAHVLTGKEDADVQDLTVWIMELCNDLQLKSLSAYGVSDVDIPLIVSKAKNASSMKGNPLVLTDEELSTILQLAL